MLADYHASFVLFSFLFCIIVDRPARINYFMYLFILSGKYDEDYKLISHIIHMIILQFTTEFYSY